MGQLDKDKAGMAGSLKVCDSRDPTCTPNLSAYNLDRALGTTNDIGFSLPSISASEAKNEPSDLECLVSISSQMQPFFSSS